MTDTKNAPLADVTHDSCVLQFVKTTPLDETSDDDYKPEFIDPVAEVNPRDVQDVKQEPADDYNSDDHKPGFIPCVVEVKSEDQRDVKQEPADDYNTEDPCFTLQVRSASIFANLCVVGFSSLLFHAGQAAIKLPSAEASKRGQCTSPGQYTLT